MRTLRRTLRAEGDLPPDLAVADDLARDPADPAARHAPSARAQTAKPQDGRAALYGDLRATCARCHAKLRDR